jgi:hypothetical protein
MPFIEIMPLSYYIQEGNFEAIDILNKSNIVIKTMQEDTRERIREEDLLDIDELLEMFND